MELSYAKPPIEKRCIGLSFDLSREAFELKLHSWRKECNKHLGLFKLGQTMRMNLELQPSLDGAAPKIKRTPEPSPIAKGWDAKKSKDSSYQITLSPNDRRLEQEKKGTASLRLHSQNAKGRNLDHGELRQRLLKWKMHLEAIFDVDVLLAVELHYHNLITPDFPVFREYYEGTNVVALGSIVRHLSTFGFDYEGYAPPEAKLTLHFAEGVEGTLQMRPKPNTAKNEIEVNFFAKTANLEGGIEEGLDHCRKVIHDLFEDTFTKEIREKFEPKQCK